MAISSNSVIHFTNKFDNIKGIIEKSGFKLKYCMENVILNELNLPFSSPMVSFCDIPLSEVKNHIDSYGNYGIGLYKSWAKKSGLNPVLYIDENSEAANSISDIFNRIMDLHDSDDGTDKELVDSVFKISQYFKNYEGLLKHGKTNNENYRFYNEREWRYVPKEDKLGDAEDMIFNDEYLKDKEKYNQKLENILLEFDIEDISYIIVNDIDEIPDILTIINTAFDDKFTAKQLKVLGTKILTTNQIYNDF